jgi:hypothetical protein
MTGIACRHLQKDFLEVYAKPWVMIERVRAHYMKSLERKILDMEICTELKISKNGLSSYKNRNSPTFTLYIIRWCIENNLSIKEFIQK